MPSRQSKALQTLLAPPLKANGFRKLGATWRKPYADAIGVVNLQGSAWSADVFYVNLGVYFTALGDDLRPTANRCHIQTRLCKLLPDPQMLITMLNWNEPVPSDEREAKLAMLLSDYAMPWLACFSDVAAAKIEVLKDQNARPAFVMRIASEFLGSA